MTAIVVTSGRPAGHLLSSNSFAENPLRNGDRSEQTAIADVAFPDDG